MILLFATSRTNFCLLDSQDGKFSYGYASSPGKRSSMEDFYETRIDGVDGEIVGLFGVFDGNILKTEILLIIGFYDSSD